MIYLKKGSQIFGCPESISICHNRSYQDVYSLNNNSLLERVYGVTLKSNFEINKLYLISNIPKDFFTIEKLYNIGYKTFIMQLSLCEIDSFDVNFDGKIIYNVKGTYQEFLEEEYLTPDEKMIKDIIE